LIWILKPPETILDYIKYNETNIKKKISNI